MKNIFKNYLEFLIENIENNLKLMIINSGCKNIFLKILNYKYILEQRNEKLRSVSDQQELS